MFQANRLPKNIERTQICRPVPSPRYKDHKGTVQIVQSEKDKYYDNNQAEKPLALREGTDLGQT
ncbi:hypothetical protein DICSQDRAFT_149591 [Dichomitus squalens LYAD-421 SS1]|uniref:Uncharacterized protein n=1 Tax=Dichomitus squalens (strain LYAD-421) TaxID=732165 RepID=R7SS37_DICSQ|nr:uncharacterized protein DICSQDRAFT_149591 [Dichomitus squalens LYAD-421 SS1]EJF57777.1 hypothetical protein DICSQDRAFT_149591 [Dichomitus squalens LYAD-421 SS1]